MDDILIFARDVFEFLANVATFFGIPLFVIVFIRENRKTRAERAREAYDRLDERFVDYVKLCLEHPDLDVFEIPINREEENISPHEQMMRERKEVMLFTMLVAIFERAYIEYMTQGSKNQPLTEWAAYIRYWCARENFQRAWKQINFQNQLARLGLKDEYVGDSVGFIHQIDKWIEEAKRPAKAEPVS